ncbi:MAG: ABC transporter permease [Oligoflexus sp.]
MIGIVKRLGFYLIAIFLSLCINFLLPRLMPGDPFNVLFSRFQGQLSPEAIAALRESMGFTDDPWHIQFWNYLTSILQGDFGISTSFFPSPVADVIWQSMGWTFALAGMALLVSFSIGSFLGVLAAWYRGGFIDRFITPSLIFLGSFPYFWLAMLLVYVFGFSLDWFPIAHAYSSGMRPSLSWEFIVDAAYHLFLPMMSIVLATMGGWILNMRNAMIAVLGTEYINLAHSKGLRHRVVLLRYAARNALLPNITGLGMALGYVLAGSLLTEIVFSYPGQGYLLIQAVRNQDFPLMQALFFCITVAVLLANWLVDIAYLWLDPRTRGAQT